MLETFKLNGFAVWVAEVEALSWAHNFSAVRLRPSGSWKSGGPKGVSPFTASEPSGVQGHTVGGWVFILELQVKFLWASCTALGASRVFAGSFFLGFHQDTSG